MNFANARSKENIIKNIKLYIYINYLNLYIYI